MYLPFYVYKHTSPHPKKKIITLIMHFSFIVNDVQHWNTSASCPFSLNMKK